MTTMTNHPVFGPLTRLSRLIRLPRLLPRARLETRIAIAAPPETVWPLIADPAAHLVWNPTLRRMEGRLEEGATFTMSLGAEGAKPMTFRPVVLRRDEGRRITWRGRLWVPGLFDGIHTLRLEPDGKGGTVFVNEEDFVGLLLLVMGVGQFRPDFEAANAGLKRLAEGQTR